MASRKYEPPVGPPLTEGGEGKIVLIPPTEPEDDGSGWGVQVASAGFIVDMDASKFADAMTRAHLIHTRESILTGKRPDGGGEQRKLGPKAATKPGRQSPYRGFATGVLADGLRRTKIKGTTQRAFSKITGPGNRNVYLAQEKGRGVDFITGQGAARKVMEEAAAEVLKAAAKGREIPSNPEETGGDDV